MANPLFNLKDMLKAAVAQHFRSLLQLHGDEQFYGYSLYTSDDVSGIGPVANRERAIKVASTDSMYNYYRYCPDEWSDWDDFELFSEVNRLIRQRQTASTEGFPETKRQLLAQALQALQELEAQGLFGPQSDKRFLIVWVSDSRNPIINESAKILNTSRVYEGFLSEFAT